MLIYDNSNAQVGNETVNNGYYDYSTAGTWGSNIYNNAIFIEDSV